jgi:UDP-glucose 4-epimerase
MVIPRFIEQALAGDPLTVYGTGEQTRDFTYVDDAIKATIDLARGAKGFEIYNIANEREATILDLAKTIIDVTSSNSEIKLINAPSKRYDYEVGRRFGSSEKLIKKTGYKPTTDLNNGLRTILIQN